MGAFVSKRMRTNRKNEIGKKSTLSASSLKKFVLGIERIYKSNLVKLGRDDSLCSKIGSARLNYVWSVEKKSKAFFPETSGRCRGQASEHNHIDFIEKSLRLLGTCVVCDV